MSSPANEPSLSLADRYEQLKVIVDIGKRLSSNLDLHSLLRDIASTLRRTLDTDVVAVWVLNAEETHLQMYAVDFPGSQGIASEGRLIPVEGTLIGDILKRHVPEVSDFGDPVLKLSEEEAAIAHSEGIRFGYAGPMYVRDRKLGVFSLGRKTDKPFTADDVEMADRVVQQVAIALSNAIAYKDIAELKDKLAQEKLYLEEEIRSEMDFEQIVGSSPPLKHVLQLVETVAPTDSTVLLLGETGTGKELIARAIHDRSRRKERTFVKLNCAAIPTGLLESELFGHEKGAFTGAISQKIGRMELADQGTLFLDEVGDIPTDIQPKLLRALQEREFERLGSIHTRRVNVRLIAATNRDLEKMIADREFRSDLFYRLNVFPIRIPPLRERKEDIPLLVGYFVQKFARQMQKKIDSIPPATMKGLVAWDWPGNIRELENFAERSVILTRGKSLEAPLSELRKPNSGTPPLASAAVQPVPEDLARMVKETVSAALNGKRPSDEYPQEQREEIIRVLFETKGRVGGADGAAARMGINRTTLISRMKRLGIDPRQYAA